MNGQVSNGMRVRVAYVTNSGPRSGVGARAYALLDRLRAEDELSLTHFSLDGMRGELLRDGSVIARVKPFGPKSLTWIRLGLLLRMYLADFELVHYTNQSLSFLVRKNQRSIVTVHDLIELLDPQDWRATLINKFLYGGIRKASRLIAVSEYTRQSILDYFGDLDQEIGVIKNAVGEQFAPLSGFDEQELRSRFNISAEARIVLCVGSDHPRKNLETALRASHGAAVQLVDEDLVFVKIGGAGLASGRVRTMRVLSELGLENKVVFIETVSDEELNQLYNLADVVLHPSRFEGFGLPPLQAMAAGTPVICSDATSLPEVVGEAAVVHSPDDVDGFTASLVRVLTDLEYAAKLRARGLEQAQKFSWDVAATDLLSEYKKTIG